jgi:hypothetical protein
LFLADHLLLVSLHPQSKRELEFTRFIFCHLNYEGIWFSMNPLLETVYENLTV